MDRIGKYGLNLLEQWEEYKEILKKYRSNGDIANVVKLIDAIERDGIQPVIELVEGQDWLVFRGVEGTKEIRVYPLITSFCNRFVVDENLKGKVVDRTVTNYSFSFINGVRLSRETVTNTFVNDGEDDYMLCEGEVYYSDCNENGFQYHAYKKRFKSGKLIYVDGKLIKKDELYLPTEMGVACACQILINIDFKTCAEDYGVHGVHESMLVNPRTVNGVAVVYSKDENTSLCFPLFYDEKKLINIHTFMGNELLQLPVVDEFGCNVQSLNYEGHSYRDLSDFLKRRKVIAKSLVKAEYDTQITEGVTNAQMLLLNL